MSEREKLLAKENISDEFAQKKGKEYQKLPMHEGDSKSSQSHWESEVSQNVFTPKEAIDYFFFRITLSSFTFEISPYSYMIQFEKWV